MTKVGTRTIKKLLRPGNVRINDVPCLPLLYDRFQPDITVKLGGAEIFRDLIVDNLINCSVPGPCSARLIIEKIAEAAEKKIPIEFLSPQLNEKDYPRGRGAVGFPGKTFDEIAACHSGFGWWISEKGLNVGPVPRESTNSLNELVGRLILVFRTSANNPRISKENYLEIARQLDARAFKVTDCLTKKDQEKLAYFNQKNAKVAIKSFTAAFATKQANLGWLAQSIKRKMYRYAEKYVEKRY